MDQQGAWQQTFGFFPELPVVVEPVQVYLSSDGGLLPMRQLDEKLGLTEPFATVLVDPRDGPHLIHTYREMTRMRVYGILAGYEDQNDHDALRREAVFKLISGRSPDGDDMASQPTLSRFENAITPGSLLRLQDVFLDQCIASFSVPPTHLTFDIDVFDDPVHGQQQWTFFHGYYDPFQYLPRVITGAENDLVVMVALLFGTAPPTLGLVDDLAYLVRRLREAWPDIRISIRADSGFAVPSFYQACEALQLDYTIGLKRNAVLQRNSDETLQQAVASFEETSQPQRLFVAFGYRAESWPAERFVVVKTEANAQGTHRRAVVSHRRGAPVLPPAAYDEYAERGESENRHQERKRSLRGDRLSDHRFMANYVRLSLHGCAANLLVRVRQVAADPPSPQPPSEVPTEALEGRDRQRYFNQRRKHDPLGEGHAETWRLRLIKVACHIVVSTRRVLVRLCGTWPFLDHYRDVSAAVLDFCASLACDTG
ncbi:MAG: hypothetical protein A2W31_02580 [Planctomycetes bacterium RBG_16_64_10]|nr:MAG: hypothetical protein A2W31_02580 [Planctomycetes bacterium RBG_16_64_10]